MASGNMTLERRAQWDWVLDLEFWIQFALGTWELELGSPVGDVISRTVSLSPGPKSRPCRIGT